MDMDVEGRSAGVNQSGSDIASNDQRTRLCSLGYGEVLCGRTHTPKLLSTQVSGARPSSHEGTSGSFNIAQPQAEVS